MALDDIDALDDIASFKADDICPPRLAALFLIRFDLKVGYTIAWKQCLDGVPLEGVVEYKCLPSGLHNVKEDLVYFVQEQYAGISAFVNTPASHEERNALFIAVGAMVRLGNGRLGRAWEHAGALKELAVKAVDDTSDMSSLEEYWENHRIPDGETNERNIPQSPFTAAQKRTRTLSSISLAPQDRRLSPYHPARSILDYLDTFGPLVFPLHRAALLRKRILFMTVAPVNSTCEYVYDLAILSSLPLSLSSSIPLPSPSFSRLPPLFNVGIHDIPYLSSYDGTSSPVHTNGHTTPPVEEHLNVEHGVGWIGCTTDDILAMKHDLYDILIELPHAGIKGVVNQQNRCRKPMNKWPVIKRSDTGAEIKATQRDLRRYKLLRRTLTPLSRNRKDQDSTSSPQDEEEDDEEDTHLLYQSFSDIKENEYNEADRREEFLAEPTTWSAAAYNSFMWWASAGAKEEGLAEEEEHDHKLISDLCELVRRAVEERRYLDEEEAEPTDLTEVRNQQTDAQVEMGVVTFFHRVTKQLFQACMEILDENSGSDDDESVSKEDGIVRIGSGELSRCGLDIWSEADRTFAAEFMEMWFERAVEVQGRGVECCGIRIY